MARAYHGLVRTHHGRVVRRGRRKTVAFRPSLALGRPADTAPTRLSIMRATTKLGRNTKFLPPVTYQGGKGRLATEIVERMGLPVAGRFYDLCCGSGAVSVAAVERGQSPERITMVDLGPW